MLPAAEKAIARSATFVPRSEVVRLAVGDDGGWKRAAPLRALRFAEILQLVMFRGAAVEAVLPACAGFVNGLLDEVAENPEHARRTKASEHAHEDFVGECALHLRKALSTSLAAPRRMFGAGWQRRA